MYRVYMNSRVLYELLVWFFLGFVGFFGLMWVMEFHNRVYMSCSVCMSYRVV